ncbi:hypothetical protein QBC47DRAFT_331922 [Echria macrotheca]|uniref:FAD-binding PCMH-type domain-containing protein n=1 Tax=Echria macrotheca TaxID=438768 RepID=A0AAJ0B408_9PEZI|nr:hypothetical protein QBC47DRAFT_331922 [Echria macrotheca]
MSTSPEQRLLAAGLPPSTLLLPTSSAYTARESSYWSATSRLQPAAIITPRSTADVSLAIRALTSTGQKFAIRSGGHMAWPGSNNVSDGVTLDLGELNGVEYDAASETVALGPGARWGEVYRVLHPYGRAVAGGREGNVGVGGLVVGGGNTYFTARLGFACDNVVEFEVVLADGGVVRASKDGEYADLFTALKGGGNNFGVVTQVRMTAIPCDKVWGGMAIYGHDQMSGAIEATVDFTENVAKDVDSNLVTLLTYTPTFGATVAAAMFVQVAGVEKAPAYDKWLAMKEMVTTAKMTTLHELANDYKIPADYYATWFTLSVKNDASILTKVSELHDGVVADLHAFIPESDFITQCVLQPLPRLFAERSVAAGGNMLGIENHAHDGILLLMVAMVKKEEQHAFAYAKVKRWTEQIREFAATVEDSLLEWTYLNYADKSQDPLSSYGEENVKTIKEVAAKYDPNGVFQTLCPGGFKVSHVTTRG